MKILVINSGSSSIKYQLFDMKSSRSLCKGVVDRIGSRRSSLTHQKGNKKPVQIEVKAPEHQRAMEDIFAILTDPKFGVIKSHREIFGIGHRVVHGAEVFTEPTIIDKRVIRTIERFNELAPLHNPPALLGIKASRNFVSNIPQVAVFDTAFHETMPPKAYIYGIPYSFYKQLKVRRYGFHGTSHKFVAHQAAKKLRRDIRGLKIITCHLGNGCSIAAVHNGRSVDTSMGFTPLEGLLMGTRCGDIDPAAVLYMMEKKGLNTTQMNDLLNKKSGLLGISGVSNDMRDVLKSARKSDKRSKAAIELFIYRIEKYIGAYTAAMDGLDAVVLTAGIGEHSHYIKKRISEGMNQFLKRFKARILVIPTDEELMIARDTASVIRALKR
ncbi:MAG: acetate kinase [Candidatus Omnitrophica bacterium]|nr:acetate kinase [Candidatus Omnitrophota bacterium]